MSKTTRVTTKTKIVNPAYKPGGSDEAIFPAGATVNVPTELADKWIADGSADAVEDAPAEKTESKPKK